MKKLTIVIIHLLCNTCIYFVSLALKRHLKGTCKRNFVFYLHSFHRDSCFLRQKTESLVHLGVPALLRMYNAKPAMLPSL